MKDSLYPCHSTLHVVQLLILHYLSYITQTNSIKKPIGGSIASLQITYHAGTLTQSTP